MAVHAVLDQTLREGGPALDGQHEDWAKAVLQRRGFQVRSGTDMTPTFPAAATFASGRRILAGAFV
jgi:hypothetical protein